MRTAVIRLIVVAFVSLMAVDQTLAATDDARLDEPIRVLMQKLLQCQNDACRSRIQAELTDLIDRFSRDVMERGTGPSPHRMQLPVAGAIGPNAETWSLELQGTWTTTVNAQAVHSRIEAQVTLRADSRGVFTGNGTVYAETSMSSPPHCSVEPMTGSGAVQLGALRDGDFLWIWIIPREGVRTTGRMSCTVQGVTVTSEAEAYVVPEQELMLASPVLLLRREGSELVSHGNARGLVGAGRPSVAHGNWQRLLRLSLGQHRRDRLPPPEDPNRQPSRSWLLEVHQAQEGFEQRGEVAFVAPAGGGRVRGIGWLSSAGQGVASRGRLLLDGEIVENRLRFVPRATLDDTTGHGVEQHDLAALFFNALFLPGDQRVALPLRDGATLKQGPVTWRLSGYTPCRLAITMPTEGRRFRFGIESPARLELQLAAEVKPARLRDRIVWSLPTFGAGRVEFEPKSLTGPTLKVRLEGLPKLNTDFGAKTIEARLQAPGGCAGVARRQLKLFFSRDASNNPSGTEPNWFYYWSQTSARSGVRPKYGGRQGHCGKQAAGDTDTLGYYRTSRFGILPSTYVICDLTKLGADMAFEAPIWTFQPTVHQGKPSVIIKPKIKRLTGIDTFGLVSLHESEHMTHLRRWWLNAQGAPIDKFERAKRDTDRDDLPDKEEKDLNDRHHTLVLEVGKQATNAGIDDEEFFTQLVHDRRVVGSANAEDWAYPGKQWPK